MKILSWNIQWGRGVDGRVDLDRIVADARALADFDVLCLQEVADGFDRLPGHDGGDQFAELARRLPGHTALAGIATELPPRHGAGRRRRFGNMIFSRLPVLQSFAHLLPWPADPGVPGMQRMALEATVRAPFGLLRITCTHLAYYSAVQRAAQLVRLAELHAQAHAHARAPRTQGEANESFEVQPRGGPAVLVGDFNCRPGAPELAALAAPPDAATPPYRDAWAIAHPGQPHAPTAGLYDKAQWPGEAFACDFAFVGADLAPRVRGLRVEPGTQASDHQPLVLELA